MLIVRKFTITMKSGTETIDRFRLTTHRFSQKTHIKTRESSFCIDRRLTNENEARQLESESYIHSQTVESFKRTFEWHQKLYGHGGSHICTRARLPAYEDGDDDDDHRLWTLMVETSRLAVESRQTDTDRTSGISYDVWSDEFSFVWRKSAILEKKLFFLI